MLKPKILVLRVAGTNCDRETEWALKSAGAHPERVHINRIKSGETKLGDYEALIIPGGFSYGDDISAGKVLANEIRHNLGEDIRRFIEAKKPVIGICNGFQVLAKTGLIPWGENQVVTLGWNNSARFEDRWVHLKVEDTACPFFKGLPRVIRLPVAHAEGRFIMESRVTMEKIFREKLVPLRYCTADGSPGEYPDNPNGSERDIAGLISPGGLVLGMMPHPERALLKYHDPDWHNEKSGEEYGIALRFFQNIVEYLS